MIHLKAMSFKKPPQEDQFPYSVPVIRSLDVLNFTAEVTFLVGENGSGKSTVMETIAAAARLPAVGAVEVEQDATLTAIRNMAKTMRLAWTKRTHRGFFMRSEDFFGFVKRIAQSRQELHQELDAVEREYAGKSEFTKSMARMAYAGQLHGLQESYGEDLDAFSHGESYFKLFQSRFVPDGLYLLDEPEAPLSPMRQLAFLAQLKQMVDQNAQFIIATHSPILLAYPGAVILSCDDGVIQPVAYDDLDHVNITRSFLNDPQAYLKHLME